MPHTATVVPTFCFSQSENHRGVRLCDLGALRRSRIERKKKMHVDSDGDLQRPPNRTSCDWMVRFGGSWVSDYHCLKVPLEEMGFAKMGVGVFMRVFLLLCSNCGAL